MTTFTGDLILYNCSLCLQPFSLSPGFKLMRPQRWTVNIVTVFRIRGPLSTTCLGVVFTSLDSLSVSQEFSGFNPYPNNNWFSRPWKKRTFENIVGKGEISGSQHFSFFHNVLCLIRLPKLIVNNIE